jgi:hypothetical protein
VYEKEQLGKLQAQWDVMSKYSLYTWLVHMAHTVQLDHILSCVVDNARMRERDVVSSSSEVVPHVRTFWLSSSTPESDAATRVF